MVVKKKMGRPVGAKSKVAPSPVSFKDVHAEGKLHAEDAEPLVSADTIDEFKILRDRMIGCLHPEEARVAQLIELQRMVKSLEHQAIGYRAVISYLEHTIASSGDK
jgi:hypothetical protein